MGLGRVVVKKPVLEKEEEKEESDVEENCATEKNYYQSANSPPVCLYVTFLNLNKEAKNDKSGEGSDFDFIICTLFNVFVLTQLGLVVLRYGSAELISMEAKSIVCAKIRFNRNSFSFD